MSDKRCTKVCGNPECSISTGIAAEELTFGSGELDDFGLTNDKLKRAGELVDVCKQYYAPRHIADQHRARRA